VPKTSAFLILCSLILTLPAMAQPVANFTASPIKGCSPLRVDFINQTTGGATNYYWFFGNGNTSDTVNPSAIYITPGTYDVMLIATNATGSDTVIKHNFITVFANPVANMNAAPRTGCAPQAVSFTDISTPGDAPVNNWLWDFGDGTISTLQHPGHTFQIGGSYKVSLRVIDTNSCMSLAVRDNYIVLDNPPIANFTAPVQNSCSRPFTVNFESQATGQGPFTYQWDFGDGNTGTGANPNHTYSDTGFYDVRLIVANNNGCADTITKAEFIKIFDLAPEIGIDTLHGCLKPLPTNFQFSNQTTSAHNFQFWKFGDGNTSSAPSPTYAYSKAGIFTVQLIVGNYLCLDTAEVQVHVQQVSAHFTIDAPSVCDTPVTANFLDNSTNAASWHWDFGTGDTASGLPMAYTYHNEGTYPVNLTVTSPHGCEAEYTGIFNFSLPRLSISGPTQGCVPFTVPLLANSVNGHPFNSCAWSFPDGTTATGLTTSKVFGDTGTFVVYATVVTSAGCTITDSFTIEVSDRPTILSAYLNNDTVCYKADLGLILNMQGDADKITYIFTGDDNHSDEMEWPGGKCRGSCGPGSYNEILLIPSYRGCVGDTFKITDTFVVIGARARFSDSINCANPFEIILTNNSDGHAKDFTWHFPDGTTSNNFHEKYQAPGEGNYLIMLSAVDSTERCYDTLRRVIGVNLPRAHIAAADTVGCNSLTTSLSGSGSLHAESYYWILPISGNVHQGKWLNNLKIDSPGSHIVQFVAVNKWGCTDTAEQHLLVRNHQTGIAYPGPMLGCAPLQADLQGLATADTTVTGYEWQITGLGARYTKDISFQLPSGTYDFKLTTTDAFGCTDSALLTITATRPRALFFPTKIKECRHVPVLFENYSTSQHGLSYQWHFGDGGTDTARNPLYAFTQRGLFDVMLIVTDTNGCSDTMVRPNLMQITAPIADFSVSNTYAPCPPLLIDFTDLSVSSIVSWKWDFGDNTGSILQNPQHNYTGTGFYDVTLIVVDNQGCVDTVVYPDLIELGGPRGIFHVEPDTGCAPHTVTFTVLQPVDVASAEWDFGDGRTANGMSVTHTYLAKGVYYPNLVLSNSVNCTGSFEAFTTIVVDTLKADFDIANDNLCRGELLNISDNSFGDVDSWFWLIDTFAAHGQSLPPFSFNEGNYTATLIATSILGCIDTMIKPFTVHPLPVASVQGDTFACQDDPVQLIGNSTLPSTYVWIPADGLDEPTSRTPLASPSATTIYSVVVIDANNGCRDTSAGHLLEIFPNLTGMAGPDTLILPGDTVSLFVGHNLPVTGYFWYPDPTLSCDTCREPWVNPYRTTTYFVEIEDTVGCDKIVLKVLVEVNDEVRVAVPEAFSPNGDGINDLLFVQGWGIKELLDFRIYNRWGELVFRTSDIKEGWDGNYRDRPQDIGSFVYVATVRSYSDREVTAKGSFTLLR
jgi:gliding motility-associated-like protein